MLGLGTDQGVVIWDLARGTELALLADRILWQRDVRGLG